MLARLFRQNMRLMNDRPPHYLREWRKSSGYKSVQAAVDEATRVLSDRVIAEGEEGDLKVVGLSQPNLNRIETYQVPYNQRLLEILAEIYKTDPASLIMRNPADPEGIWSIYDQIPVAERPTALRVLSGFKTGTEG